jgi:hypothetical protein
MVQAYLCCCFCRRLLLGQLMLQFFDLLLLRRQLSLHLGNGPA